MPAAGCPNQAIVCLLRPVPKQEQRFANRRTGRVQLGQRAALYYRVSTPEQKPDLQYDGLHGYAARAGLEVADIKTQEMRCAWRSATITISASGAASDVRCSENVEDGTVIDGRLRLANSCHSR